MKRITKKVLCEDIIHRSMGITEMCVKHECTEDELKQCMSSLYNKGSDDKKNLKKLQSQLATNEKRYQKNLFHNNRVSSADAENVDVTDLDVAKAIVAEDNIDIVADMPQVLSLEELKQKESELSDSVFRYETKRKGLYQKRASLRAQLDAIRQEILGYRKIIVTKQEDTNRIGKEVDEISNQILSILDSERADKLSLENVRKQIEERAIIYLFVDSDANVVVEGDLDVTDYDEIDYSKAFSELSFKYIQLRGKDILSILKVLYILEHTKFSIKTSNIAFDKAEVEEVFVELCSTE